MALRLAARARAGAVLRGADPGRAGGEFLHHRRLWRADANVHALELRRDPALGTDAEPLSRHREIHRADLDLHARDWLLRGVFPGVSRPQPIAGDRALPGLHGAVLDLEHHPDDF